MSVGTLVTSRSYLSKQLTSIHRALTEKSTQLSTGKVSSTYGGVGDNRLLDLQLTQKVGQIDSYQETITRANLHLKTLNLTLDRLENLRLDAKSAYDPNDFELEADGQTQTQSTAELLFHETVNLLNTEVAGYYLFGGTDTTNNPVADIDAIMNGSGTLAGFRTVSDEYVQANLGANNNGRLDISALTTNYAGLIPTDSTFTIAEDGAHDFGFDISSVTSGLSNTTITGPGGGDPDSFDVTLTGQPNQGETISIEFTLPPNHTDTYTLELTATDGQAGENQFLIGADLEETTQNLRDAISSALEEEAQTNLKAIANQWAADEFFDTYNGGTTMRVDGPPYDTATGVVDGSATTVAWYTGENSVTTNPREDKRAVIDANLTLNYGARANEQGITDLMKSLATFVAADFSGGTATDEKYYNTLSQNMRTVISPNADSQSGISNIATDVAIAYRTLEMTEDRHTQMKSSYLTTVGEIEGVDKDTLAMEILQLQTNLETSYRASSIVFQLSLVNYI